MRKLITSPAIRTILRFSRSAITPPRRVTTIMGDIDSCRVYGGDLERRVRHIQDQPPPSG